MRELKILYRKEWLIYLSYVLAGIGIPSIMTLLALAVGSEDASSSFNGVYNTTLLMGGIASIWYLEHESRQLEVGCFVVNRKRYMQFRIVQIMMRGIVLAIALMLGTLVWRGMIPGGAEFLDTSYAVSMPECCIACGIIFILMNSISLLDSTRKKPVLTTFVDNGKRNSTIVANYRPAASTGRRVLGGIAYYIIIVIENLVFQVVIHEKEIIPRMVTYTIIGAICIVLWGISICFMRKKELGQQ